MKCDCLQHPGDDWFHAGEVNAAALIIVPRMRQRENRTGEVHLNPGGFRLRTH
jgi:hypothetical protein